MAPMVGVQPLSRPLMPGDGRARRGPAPGESIVQRVASTSAVAGAMRGGASPGILPWLSAGRGSLVLPRVAAPRGSGTRQRLLVHPDPRTTVRISAFANFPRRPVPGKPGIRLRAVP